MANSTRSATKRANATKAVGAVTYQTYSSVWENTLVTDDYKFITTYQTGTLANGKVYITTSTLDPNKVMLGLFAGIAFQPNDRVTCYGGIVRTTKEARSLPVSSQEHIRRLPESDFVLDGKPFADMFAAGHSALSIDQKLPLPAIGSNLLQFFVPQVLPIVKDAVEFAVVAKSGLGYMANTTAANRYHNVKVVYLWPNKKSGLAPPEPMYIATKPIQPGQEIIAPYHRF